MKITIQNLSKALGGRDIFSDFSLDIDSGVQLCLCGPNGSGKSTLIKMLAGVETPDSGRVILPKNFRLGYVQQDFDESALDRPLLAWVMDVLPAWHKFWEDWDIAVKANDKATLAQLTTRQAELEAQYGYSPEHQAQEVLSGLGFDEKKWQMTLRQLSGGWRERAKLAKILVAGADALLLDEPTNHLDIEAVEWLENFLLEYKGILVFVAHDRVFMDRVGSHVLYLGGPKPLFRKATFSQFIAMQAELEEQREREAKHLNAEIERKLDFVRRFGVKATKARQAQSRLKMAKKLEKELEGYRPDPKRKELRFTWPEASKSDKTILSASDLAFSFPDGESLWPPLTFTLYRGQRVALVGPNGCGKSTLLKILVGQQMRTGGNLTQGSLVRLGYYSQHQTEILRTSNTVLSELRRLSDPRTNEEELMSVLGLFLLGQQYFDRLVSSLSGGERSRLVLASLFLAKANFLVLDEPTNHLDLESREALVEALELFEGTLLIVAHDRYLLANVADEAWAISKQGITVYKEGFEQYDIARKAALVAKNTTKNEDGTRNETQGRDEAKRIRREQAEKRNALHKKLKPAKEAYANCESKLDAVLKRQAEVEKLLANPEVFADQSKTSQLLSEFQQCQTDSETLLAEMERLEQEIHTIETADI